VQIQSLNEKFTIAFLDISLSVIGTEPRLLSGFGRFGETHEHPLQYASKTAPYRLATLS
jgi:hypothetical protein